MKKYTIHVCSFDGGPDVTRKTTYEEVRTAVLASGRFSVFEATETPHAARLYSRLMRDQTLEITRKAFPWTAVRLKTNTGDR